MDKNTLSNYGWIVIAVLVLSVMIALATPFGSYIEQGVRATTEGLFSTSQNAMNNAFGDLGVEVKDQIFEEGYQTSNDNANESELSIAGATFRIYATNDCHNEYTMECNENCLTGEEIFLTWDELKLEKNGLKYGYDHTQITDTKIGGWVTGNCKRPTTMTSIVIPNTVTTIDDSAFWWCTNLKTVTIPNSVTFIGDYSFRQCYAIETINYDGTVAQFEEMIKDKELTFSYMSPIFDIVCIDEVTTNNFVRFSITDIDGISHYYTVKNETSWGEWIKTHDDFIVFSSQIRPKDSSYAVAKNGILVNENDIIISSDFAIYNLEYIWTDPT